MPIRHREEVLNVVLAQVVVSRGLNATPESISHQGKYKPDVLIGFRGARCIIEGKIDDVQDAKGVVCGDARGRIENGIAQLAVAVVYPTFLRATRLPELPAAIASATLAFRILSEQQDGEWVEGTVDAILDELRRGHEMLSSDDVVRQAAGELSERLKEVANLLLSDSATAPRLIELLGIGEEESADASTD